MDMTLQEIFDILNANIAANGGTLKLSPQTISSPGITEIFDKYLLNEDLIVDEAVPILNAQSVTVTGNGNSLIFFDTKINALTFTVDAGVPSMSVNAYAIIKDEDGWSFGRSFPVLKFSNWSGFFDPGDPKKWIQYIFFYGTGGGSTDSPKFSLSDKGLIFSGFLMLEKGLEPLAILFNHSDKIEVKGLITLNKGEDGYIVDKDTVVPEMKLIGNIGVVDISLGSFPVFTLSFEMDSSAFIVPKGDDKGKPVPILEMLIKSTIPINDEEIGIAIVVGTQAGSLTMRAVLPEKEEVGISELIALANNENLLAIMPSNIPVINDFVLKDWQLTFNPKEKTLTMVTIEVATRETFSWVIIPGFLTLKSVSMTMAMTYLNKTFSPSLDIEGIITIGTGTSAVNFIISAAFPSYVFMGALDPETPIDLKGIVAYFLGDTVANSLPDTLQLGVLSIAVDPKNSTYSLETALTTDMKIPVILTTIVVRTVAFNISYVAGVPSGSITGEFQVGTEVDSPFLFVTAAYAGEDDTWVFSGGLKDGSKIKLKQLIDTYLPDEYHAFNPFDITITTLFASFTQAPPATPGNTEGAENTYNFKLGAEWKLDLGLSEPFIITGLTEIAYKKSLTGSPYKGYIEGALDFGNIHVGARVDFKDKYNDYIFFFNGFEARLTKNAENDSIICFRFTDESTLGSLIELLINAATGQDITLPSPWNVMNNIKLSDLGFSFNITKNKIGFTCPIGINLGFIDIKRITLYYTYFPNDPNKEGIVEIQITEGSFLGGALPLPGPWDVAKPETAPAVPGQGENLFRLEFLGMGQHVSLKDGKSPNSVTEAVDLLKASFESDKKDPDPNNPIDGTGLKFNSSSNWLIGSQFVIVDTFAVGVVFFDPDLYGLSLYVNGPKAKVFQGLKFEILYKKVTDTIGVYQVYLKLPDSIRQIDFGTISVTLPSIKVYIYTNGDFKIDFGFPVNDDFSESFGLQLLPFIGSGGFYFGVLSAETADTVPKSSIGNFSPVVVFGVGLRVGVGKEINKGILKAGISIVVQGLLEGTFASFNYYDGNKDDITYYYVLGKISIVGHVYGAIDFLIISAEVDLKVFVSARIVFESYEPILITLSAGVSVSVKVRINLGLFKITIGLSFSTTIEFSFTIGKRELKPWDGKGLYAAQFRQLSLQALDEETGCLFISIMNWLPIIPVAKVDLEIIYIPQFTVATDEGTTEQKARAVAMLYLESAIDQPTTKQQLLINGAIEEVDYPFTKFAKGAFLWVLGAYFNKTTEGIPVDTILAQEVTIANLEEIICYFSQSDLIEPFSVEQIFTFMENYLNATITTPARTTQVVAEKTVSVLPILPNLVFETPAGDIYFDNEQAKYTYDQEQLRLIHAYFKALSVRNTGADTKQPAQLSADQEKQSLATFMLVDYIALLAKESTQKGIDRLTTMVVPVDESDSFESIVADNPHFGISAIELAYSNRTRKLKAGVGLGLKKVPYTVRHNDTLHSISQRFNVAHHEILQANTFVRQQAVDPCLPTGTLMQKTERLSGADENNQLIAGERIFIPNVRYVVAENAHETLLSVANKHGIDVLDLIAENIGVSGLLPHQSKILVPYVEKITVADLVKAMEENHDFEHLSGLSANIMLQGLRVPLPEDNSAIGKPEAMYKVSGQEIDASKLVEGDKLTLKLPESLPWLGLGTPGGTELPFTLLGVDIGALQDLQKAELKPVIVELKPSDLFRVQPRKFSLPSNITWALPVAMTLMNGDNLLQDNIDPSIWMFKNSLEALLNGYDAIAPKVSLLKQVQETQTKTAPPVPITDYSWSTKIDVRLRQVKSSEDPAKLMPNVYELQGIDPASMSLLQNLIEYYSANPGSTIINQIDILYSKDPAKDGQKEPPSGLRSDSIDNTSIYLLQTNLSTLSNPPQMANARALTAVPGMQNNLLGMSQIELLKYMWEAAVVGTGGYYLYYLVKDSKTGLPDYLFNGDTEVTISVVMTYKITDNVLLNFLNSVIVREPINIQDEILYIETLAQTVTGVTMAEGDTLQAFAKRYSTTVGEIAVQNKKAHFRQNTRLAIPGSQANAAQNGHLTAAAESLEILADKYGVSIISLAHANKHQPQLFEAPLTFDSRIEVKVATVPPGNIGFTVKRKGPGPVTDLNDAEQNLQELYNLLGYNIAPNNDFDGSVSGLPVAPGDNNPPPANDLAGPLRPTGVTDEDMPYNRIVPVYPFVKTVVTGDTSDDLPPEKENPYRAVGKTVQIDMRWQDIFGNLTSFENIPDPGPATLPDITVCYTDPVIGLSLYPSVSASYIVDKPEGDSPKLYITLAFNPTNYLPVETVEDVAWKKRADADRGTYKQIYYQLIQEDMKVIISNSLEGDTGISAIETDPKGVLIGMVTAIYQYLGEILKPGADPYVFYTVEEGDTLETIATKYNTTAQNIRMANPSIPADGKLTAGQVIIVPLVTIPADEIIESPVSDTNPLTLFALVTKLKLARELNLVGDDFKDEPSVVFATSVLGPNLKKDNSTNSDAPGNAITIQEFAQKLQGAFPELKAASGMPKLGTEEDSSIDIWVARFNNSATGIQFSIPDTGNPYYFALLPLSTHLLSRDKVKIYPYRTGTPISDETPVESAFNGIDIEKLAETCLAAIDVFLQADFSVPAWQIENTIDKPISDNGAGAILHPYQHVINTKKDLAGNIVKHMATVLADDNKPNDDNLANAMERLRQELLISLSNAYTIDTVMQFNVEVQSPYKDTSIIAPQLFGKVIDPNDTTQADQKAYAFSTTRFSLENSVPDDDKQSYLTILFNSKKENDLHGESSFFAIDLQYEINSIEHDIQDVESIKGYQASSWLTFILPFDDANTGLGKLKIPIPLRAYPTSPSLTAQTFKSIGQATGLNLAEEVGENKLQEAKEWNYTYTYDYLRAQQDTINTDIILNVPAQPLINALFVDDEDPDLFAALLQFSSAYPGIQRDFNQYLLDQSNPDYAYTAMQSFAWLVKRVATAWGKWEENKQLYADSGGEVNYKYEIVEGEKEIDKQNALLISVTPQPDTKYRLPYVKIEGFITEPVDDTEELRSFAYYTMVDGKKKYLTPDEARRITQRIIGYDKFNIINEENIWSGIAVTRNKILVPGIKTNDAFIYTTPTIRFVSVLTPLLDPDIEINIADYTSEPAKQPLQLYLSNFLKALFVELIDETTTRQIKIGTSYVYDIQENIPGLSAEIPISISTPYNFEIPADWNNTLCPALPGDITPESPFVCQLTALLQNWFAGNTPVTTNAKFRFDIQLFSGLSNTQLPVLRIRNLYLEEKNIKWS